MVSNLVYWIAVIVGTVGWGMFGHCWHKLRAERYTTARLQQRLNEMKMRESLRPTAKIIPFKGRIA